MPWTEESPHTVVVMMVIAQCKLGATLRPASLADSRSLDLGSLLCFRAGSGVQTGTWDNALNMSVNLSFSRAVISSSATPDFIRWTAQVFLCLRPAYCTKVHTVGMSLVTLKT